MSPGRAPTAVLCGRIDPADLLLDNRTEGKIPRIFYLPEKATLASGMKQPRASIGKPTFPKLHIPFGSFCTNHLSYKNDFVIQVW